MMRRLFKTAALALAGATILTGCGNGSDAMSPPAGNPPPPPPPMAVDFTTFVKDQFAATADDSEPEAVDETDFEFNDEDNPDAFGNLLESS